MKFQAAILSMVLLPAAALASQPAKAPAAAEAFHRVELKGPDGSTLPYTIEVPQDWQVQRVEKIPGLFVGPADAKLPEDPRLVWVRGSTTSLADPEKVAAAIRESDQTQAGWSAPRVEVREVGGIRGVLVRMDSGEGQEARSTLALKLPLEKLGIDFLVSAPRAEFETRLPLYERILLSVRSTATAN
jgi:hypothetical protein